MNHNLYNNFYIIINDKHIKNHFIVAQQAPVLKEFRLMKYVLS